MSSDDWFRIKDPSSVRRVVLVQRTHWRVRLYHRALELRTWMRANGLGPIAELVPVQAARRFARRWLEQW